MAIAPALITSAMAAVVVVYITTTTEGEGGWMIDDEEPLNSGHAQPAVSGEQTRPN